MEVGAGREAFEDPVVQVEEFGLGVEDGDRNVRCWAEALGARAGHGEGSRAPQDLEDLSGDLLRTRAGRECLQHRDMQWPVHRFRSPANLWSAGLK